MEAKSAPQLSEVSFNQLRRISYTEGASYFFHLRMVPYEEDSNAHPNFLELTALLFEFQQLFTTLIELPPLHVIDHHIHLKPSTSSMNVKPYHYLHFQKLEIELQVREMFK